MEIIKSKEFKPNNSWDSKLISNMSGITTKLHWTDKPYKWHVNDGQANHLDIIKEIDHLEFNLALEIDYIQSMDSFEKKLAIFDELKF